MTSQRKRPQRSHPGEVEGKPLIEWLNNGAMPEEVSRVVGLCRDLSELASMERASYLWEETGRVVDLQFRILRAMDSCKLLPALCLSGIDFVSEPEEEIFYEFREADAVHAIAALAGLKRTHLIRQCDMCHRWIHARFKNQHLCPKPATCQQDFEKTDEGRKQAKIRQKKSREFWHSRDKKRRSSSPSHAGSLRGSMNS